MRAAEPFQLHLACLAEHRRTHATFDKLAQQRRHEDLAADGFARDARGEDDVLAVEVVAVLDRLAGVQADADTTRQFEATYGCGL